MEGSASLFRQLLTTSWGDSTKKRLDPLRWAIVVLVLLRKTPARGFSWAIVIAYFARRVMRRLTAYPNALTQVVDAIDARMRRNASTRYIQQNAIAFDDVGYLLQRNSSRLSTCSLPAIDEAKEASEDKEERSVRPPPAAAVEHSVHDER